LTLSVIIPCRDAEPYLSQAIGSALDQDAAPDEILIVDDGSRDGSVALARRFESACPGVVRLFGSDGRGAARARNLGALAASGDILMFLDADDVLGPGTLRALREALVLTPGAVAVCPWFRLELIGRRWTQKPPSCAPRAPGQDPLAAWLAGWYHPPCSVLWSREAFEAAGRWDEQTAVNQDGDLVMRALLQRVPLVEASAGAAYYRRPPHGATSISSARLTRQAIASRLRVIEKIGFHLEKEARLDAYRAAFQEAIGAVARDASGRHEDLHAQARVLARRLGLAQTTRLTRLVRRRVRGLAGAPRVPGPGAAGPVATASVGSQAVEVRWGLARAASVLAGVRDVELSMPVRSIPRVPRPLVTIVVPTYNRAGELARALASVAGQTAGDFEVLVVDDGSTDETASLVGRHPDPRVRYLRQPRNQGVSAARNRGLREARGELIAFLDADDEWMPTKLERQVAVFRGAGDELGLVYTGVETVGEDGSSSIQRPRDRGDVYREMLWRNAIHGGGSNAMIRREVVAAAGFFDDRMPAIEDHEYWLKVARFFRVDFVEEPLIRYHDPRTSIRRSLALRPNIEARWWFFRRHRAEMRRYGVAHLFLHKTLTWCLQCPDRDERAVRRLAVRTLFEAPASRLALAAFLGTTVPATARVPWVRRHAALE